MSRATLIFLLFLLATVAGCFQEASVTPTATVTNKVSPGPHLLLVEPVGQGNYGFSWDITSPYSSRVIRTHSEPQPENGPVAFVLSNVQSEPWLLRGAAINTSKADGFVGVLGQLETQYRVEKDSVAAFVKAQQSLRNKPGRQFDSLIEKLDKAQFELTHLTASSGLARIDKVTDFFVEYQRLSLLTSLTNDSAFEEQLNHLLIELRDTKDFQPVKIRPGIFAAEQIRRSRAISDHQENVLKSWCFEGEKPLDQSYDDGANALVVLLGLSQFTDFDVRNFIRENEDLLAETLDFRSTSPAFWLVAAMLKDNCRFSSKIHAVVRLRIASSKNSWPLPGHDGSLDFEFKEEGAMQTIAKLSVAKDTKQIIVEIMDGTDQ